MAIFPRDNLESANRKADAAVDSIISKLDAVLYVFFLDIGPKFLDVDGNIPADIMSDKLHPTQKGYGIWAEAMKEPLVILPK